MWAAYRFTYFHCFFSEKSEWGWWHVGADIALRVCRLAVSTDLTKLEDSTTLRKHLPGLPVFKESCPPQGRTLEVPSARSDPRVPWAQPSHCRGARSDWVVLAWSLAYGGERARRDFREVRTAALGAGEASSSALSLPPSLSQSPLWVTSCWSNHFP